MPKSLISMIFFLAMISASYSSDDEGDMPLKKNSNSEEISLASEEKQILKIPADSSGGCSDLYKFPYVYFGRDKELAEEGKVEEKKKYFVNGDYIVQQREKFQKLFAHCRSAHQIIADTIEQYEKGDALHTTLTGLESQLRAALTSYKIDKISSRSPQESLYDFVKFKRILKYKYAYMIKEFIEGLNKLHKTLETKLTVLESSLENPEDQLDDLGDSGEESLKKSQDK